MATRYKLQQFSWGFRMYDSQTEEPADGELDRFDVNLEEAELIESGWTPELRGDELWLTWKDPETDELFEKEVI